MFDVMFDSRTRHASHANSLSYSSVRTGTRRTANRYYYGFTKSQASGEK
jgi:hypothetical protein